MGDTLLYRGDKSGTAEETLPALPPDEWAKRHDDPMILRMVDWRDCSALEYVPGRNSGQATFIGRRIPVDTLADWLTTGGTLETFSDTFGIDMDSVRAVHEYMTDNPPVDTVDLTGCCSVELTPLGMRPHRVPTFVGTGLPIDILFDSLKGGRTAREFADTYNVDYQHVAAVLRHAADQDYQGPLE